MATLRPYSTLENVSDAMFTRSDYFLRCHKCGNEREVTVEKFSDFLKDGFPRCCGETMLLESEPRKKA